MDDPNKSCHCPSRHHPCPIDARHGPVNEDEWCDCCTSCAFSCVKNAAKNDEREGNAY